MAQRKLTAKQWDYLSTLEEFVAAGKPITQESVGQVARCDRRSISRWRRDPVFLRASAQVLRAHTHVDVELAHRANLRQVLMGSTKAYEALLRRLGQWDAMPPELAPTGGGPPGSAAGAQAVAQVNFFGLPQPPNAAQRAALPVLDGPKKKDGSDEG